MLIHNESNFLRQHHRIVLISMWSSKRVSYAQDFYAGENAPKRDGVFMPTSQPVLLNELPAHKLILNVRVVNRCCDETGDAESGLHDEHREQ